MFDYRNHLKRILQKTTGDQQSLDNSLAAIKAIIAMADTGQVKTQTRKAVPLKKQADVAQNHAAKKEIKSLLLSLSELLAHPGEATNKQTALAALHKLTFVPGLSKQYGRELSKLEEGIHKSVPTTAAVNAQIFASALKPKPRPKRDYRKGKRYTVIRLLSGADLINENGETAFHVSEAQAHPLNLKSGDIVEAVERGASAQREAEVLRVVGYQKLRTRDYDPIEDFKYAVVQGRPGHLAISRNIRGQKLRIRGKDVLVPVDASYYQGDDVGLEDGSIVDLAWYSGDVRLKKDPAAAVRIRWIYQVDQPKIKTKVKKKKAKSKDEPEKISKLAMDLHYQRVGIAIGANQNENILDSIVTRYHGIPIPIDAFEGKKKVMQREIQDLDIVVLVTAFAAHDATWNIQSYASKYGVKFAVSSSKGYQSFERALYRAENGLPAYEGNQSIDYKKQE